MDIAHLQRWIGHRQDTAETLAPFPANALSATLDRDDPPFADGTPLPPLWHWLHFLPVFRLSAAGYDGHAALGEFLPPVPLPRRMWAGGRLRFHAPLRIGQPARKTSVVEDVRHKQGRSGDLVFVTVRHEIFEGATPAITEWHDIVYRAAPDADAPMPAPPKARDDARFSHVITPDPVLLFRYSALTFNGHRIHYDAPFATESEGYDGLVVHGPLLATLLVDLARRSYPQAQITGFRFRALSTLVVPEPVALNAAPRDGQLHLWATGPGQRLVMEAQADLDPVPAD